MPNYHYAIHQMLQKSHAYEKKPEVENFVISYLLIQKISQETKIYLQQYSIVKNVCIIHCDLRTLINFPILNSMTHLDISNNSLQGTFEHIIKNKSLEYLNISNNLIPQIQKLSPLKRIKNLSVFLKNNPFCSQQNWNTKIKIYNFKNLKEPHKYIESPKKIEPKQQPPIKQVTIQPLPQLQSKIQKEMPNFSSNQNFDWIVPQSKISSPLPNEQVQPQLVRLPSSQEEKFVFSIIQDGLDYPIAGEDDQDDDDGLDDGLDDVQDQVGRCDDEEDSEEQQDELNDFDSIDEDDDEDQNPPNSQKP